MQMALSGEPILANEAYNFGLVARVVKKGEAVTSAMELAGQVAQNAPLAVAGSKRLIRGSYGRTVDELWEFQGSEVRKVFASGDAKEGPRAFAEKREPNWSGR
jgi:enoyl-CoA hydratase/carnithine racemase